MQTYQMASHTVRLACRVRNHIQVHLSNPPSYLSVSPGQHATRGKCWSGWTSTGAGGFCAMAKCCDAVSFGLMGGLGGDGKSCRCHCLISLLLTRRKWGRWMNKKILKNIEDTFTRTLLDCNCRQQWSVKNIVCCKVSELRCGIVWNTFVAVHRQVFAANVCTRHNFREACWKHPFGDAEIRGNNRVLWFHVSVKEGFWSTSQVWSRD